MMVKMTKAEVLEKYGDVEVTFSHYYKFSFTFTGESGGNRVMVAFGGDADCIYRTEVANNETCKVKDIDFYSVDVMSPEGNILETFYDY